MTSVAEIKTVTRLRDLQVDGRQDMSKIDPRSIVVEAGFNPRDFSLQENRAHIDRLKASIKVFGVEQPLWVRWHAADKTAILVDGECRLKAVLELIAEGVEIVSVPVIQKSLGVGTVADRLALALTANEGQRLSASEVGKTYIRLIGYGWSEARIAERTGKSERFVRDAIAISDAPDAVRELVANGDVSQALALKTVKEQGSEAAVEVLEQAAKEAKADGKKTATAPKKDKKLSKLRQIRAVMDDFESVDGDHTKQSLINYLADIADILDEQPAAQKAA